MTPQEIKIGTRFEFEMLDSNYERVGHTLVSQLLELQPDGSMVISVPISEARIVFVPTGITVRLTFVHLLHGLLGFMALVKLKEYRGNIAVLIVEPDEAIEKIQRREYFRLDVIMDALILPLSDEAAPNESSPAEVAPVKAYTRNLSGSGVCVISETNFPKNSWVRVELDLNGSVRFEAKCIILRSDQIEVKRGRSYELGMRFMEITKKDQDNLVKFIFDQQRKLLKKDK
jgi:c-di-GMP-binding flagellar brake protein YcgR